MASSALPIPVALRPMPRLARRPALGAVRRALRLFVEETAAARRRAAVAPLERATALRVAKWFVFQGEVFVRVAGAELGARMDREAALHALARAEGRHGRRLAEDISWGDWDYLLNQVMTGRHPGGLFALRDIIADGRTTAYAAGAEAGLADLGLDNLAIRIAVGSDAAVAHAAEVAARQVTRINDTTRGQLRTLITEAVENGWSWNRTAEAIIERYKDFAGKPLFPSRTFTSRAEMVAAYEIGDAYEAGGEAQARAAQAAGVPMEKGWLDAGDGRVREAHKANSAAGWLPLDATFPDGSPRPPTDGGCRCALMYRVAPGYFDDEEDEADEAAARGATAAPGRVTFMPLPDIYGRAGKGVRRSPYRTAESERARRAALRLKPLGEEIERRGETLSAAALAYETEGDFMRRVVLYNELQKQQELFQSAWVEYDAAVTRLLAVPDASRAVIAVTEELAVHFPGIEALAEDSARFISRSTLSDDALVKVGLLPPEWKRSISFGDDSIGIAQTSGQPDIAFYHELGHVVEAQNGAVNSAALAFRARRTAGQTPVALRDYLGVSDAFNADEKILPDEFLNPYMGKVYDHGDTEIVSVGLEYMRFHAEALAARDPDYFHFMYHVLRGNYDVLLPETTP